MRWLLVGYASFYLGLAGIIWYFGDVTWFGTILLFSPRYVLAWPLFVPAAVVLFGTRRQKVVAFVVLIVGLFQVCQICLPWGRWGRQAAVQLRVLTLNSAELPAGSQDFEQLVKTVQPDVVFLQWEGESRAIEWPPDWSTCGDGEFVIASRYPLTSMVGTKRQLPERWPRTIAAFATVHAPAGDFRVGTTHLLSPRIGLSGIVNKKTVLDLSKRGRIDDEIEWRRSESSHVAAAVALQGDDLILAGDFNMPVDSNIYRAHWGRLRNAFSAAGFGFGITSVVQQGPFEFAARIDHVLFTKQWRCARCWVGKNVGSDHLPVIADLQRLPAGK